MRRRRRHAGPVRARRRGAHLAGGAGSRGCRGPCRRDARRRRQRRHEPARLRRRGDACRGMRRGTGRGYADRAVRARKRTGHAPCARGGTAHHGQDPHRGAVAADDPHRFRNARSDRRGNGARCAGECRRGDRRLRGADPVRLRQGRVDAAGLLGARRHRTRGRRGRFSSIRSEATSTPMARSR